MRAAGSSAAIDEVIASTNAPSKVVSTGGSPRHSRSTSGPRISSSSRSKASCRPGRIRQSTVASATDGITFALYPAWSIVGFAVSLRVAPTMREMAPSLATEPSRSSSGKSHPVISLTPARNSRTESVSTIGNRCCPRRVTAAASFDTALSSCSIDPCPARPRTRNVIQAMPFSAVSTRYARTPSLKVTEKPPTSLMASVTPSNSSGRCSTNHCEPYQLPASSSAKNANTMSRGGTIWLRLKCRATAIDMPSMSFMSTAPRPHT